MWWETLKNNLLYLYSISYVRESWVRLPSKDVTLQLRKKFTWRNEFGDTIYYKSFKEKYFLLLVSVVRLPKSFSLTKIRIETWLLWLFARRTNYVGKVRTATDFILIQIVQKRCQVQSNCHHSYTNSVRTVFGINPSTKCE